MRNKLEKVLNSEVLTKVDIAILSSIVIVVIFEIVNG